MGRKSIASLALFAFCHFIPPLGAGTPQTPIGPTTQFGLFSLKLNIAPLRPDRAPQGQTKANREQEYPAGSGQESRQRSRNHHDAAEDESHQTQRWILAKDSKAGFETHHLDVGRNGHRRKGQQGECPSPLAGEGNACGASEGEGAGALKVRDKLPSTLAFAPLCAPSPFRRPAAPSLSR